MQDVLRQFEQKCLVIEVGRPLRDSSDLLCYEPNLERLGYCHVSLQETGFVFPSASKS
jgi:hypothetical protein